MLEVREGGSVIVVRAFAEKRASTDNRDPYGLVNRLKTLLLNSLTKIFLVK